MSTTWACVQDDNCPAGTTRCGNTLCCSAGETCTSVSTTWACEQDDGDDDCGHYDYSESFLSKYGEYVHLEGTAGRKWYHYLSSNALKVSLAIWFYDFYQLFKPKGELDLKYTEDEIKERSDCGVQFFGRDVAIDVPGNVMYGMIGYLYWHDLWEDETISFLLRSVDVGQALDDITSVDFDAELWDEIISTLSNPDEWNDLIRDNPCDGHAIENGARAVEFGSDITETQLTMFLGQEDKYLLDPKGICKDPNGKTDP